MSGSPPSGRVRLPTLPILTVLTLLTVPAAARAITGVCPDGSVFVVSRPEAIPCSGAKEVEPHQVPPLRPEYLPRPYTWEVYERQVRPNNPYNLVDPAEQVRALREAPGEGGEVARRADPPEPTPSVAVAPPGYRAAGLGLTDSELQALYRIVALSQPQARATFLKQTADGREVLRISFAHARSFEARLAEAAGPVLIFSAVAQQEASLGDQFTFVQGYLAFHPQAEDRSQMGVLQGALGELAAGEAALGYVVLPAAMDLGQPMDIYWNDRRVTATFRP